MQQCLDNSLNPSPRSGTSQEATLYLCDFPVVKRFVATTLLQSQETARGWLRDSSRPAPTSQRQPESASSVRDPFPECRGGPRSAWHQPWAPGM